jgi:hypothetical protein
MHLVLGFDRRVGWQTQVKNWPRVRRDLHLFKQNIRIPISADPNCWAQYLSELEIGFNGWFCNFFETASAASLAYGKKSDAVLVGLTLPWNSIEGKDRDFWQSLRSGIDPINPRARVDEVLEITANLSSGWKLIGFDACTSSVESALQNCGHLSLSSCAKAAWGARLNRFHLFDLEEDASIFSEFATKETGSIDTGRFWPIGIWIRETDLFILIKQMAEFEDVY